MIVSVWESHLGLQISQPPNITQKRFCIQNLHMDLSFQKKKNSLEICFLVPEILNKYKRSIFFETPCIISLYFFINIKKIWKEDPDLIFFIWSLEYVFKFVLSLGTAVWNLISIFTFLFCILYTLIYTTLNSIVSNPIKVVVVIVVIVVVVFVPERKK